MKRPGKKWRILLAVEILALLCLLPGCFQKEKLIYTMSMEEPVSREELSTLGWAGESEEFVLTPGVYQVRARLEVTGSTVGTLELKHRNPEEEFRSFLGNPVPVSAGQEEIDFEYYLSQVTPDAYVRAVFWGDGTALLKEVSVYRVNWGMRMALCILFALFVLLDGMLWLKGQIGKGRVSTKQQIVLWGLMGALILSYFPFLTDFTFRGTELELHWMRIEGLKEALLHPDGFPVRIQPGWLGGHGYAVSAFCSDLFLLFPALLRLVGFPLGESFRIFVFAVLALTVFQTYFALKRVVKEEYAALFGTILYSLAPYHIYTVFERQAVGEYLAMAFLPLAGCGLYLLCAGRETRCGKWYLAAGLTGLLQSHVPTFLLSVVVLLAVCVVLWRRVFQRETLRRLAEAAGIVLAVNCWFWLPLLYLLAKDSYAFSEIALFANGFRPFGVAQLVMAILFVAYAYRRPRNPFRSRTAVFLAGTLLGGSLGAAFGVFFASFFALWCREELAQRRGEGQAIPGYLTGRVVVTALGIVALLHTSYYSGQVSIETTPIFLYTAESLRTDNILTWDYLPADTDGEALRAAGYHEPVTQEGLLWSDWRHSGTAMTITLANRSVEERLLVLPLTGYRGYALEVLDAAQGPAPCLTGVRGVHGDLQVAVPPSFSGTIRVRYAGHPVFRVAEVVSLVSIAGLLGWGVFRRREGQKHEK